MSDPAMALYVQIREQFKDQPPAALMEHLATLDAATQESLWAARDRAKALNPGSAFPAGAIAGVSLNAGDELTGAVAGDDARAAARQRNEDLQTLYPKSYLAGDVTGSILGTAIPGAGWVAGPAKAAQAVGKLGKLAGTLARGAIWGGADAGVRGFNAAEGGPGPRLVNAIHDAPVGAAAGAVVAPVLGGFLGLVGRRMGNSARKAVEANLRQLAESEGQPISQIVARVEAGETIAGMNATTRSAARAVKGLNPTAGQAMVETALARRTGAQETALSTAEHELVGPTRAAAENLYAEGTAGLSGARTAAGETLSGTLRAAGEASDGLSAEIGTVLQRNPDVAARLRKTLRTQGTMPLLGADGSLLRRPTIQEAETIYREMHDTATAAFKGDAMSTSRGAALQETYRPLREMIDAEGQGVAAARSGYESAAQAERQGFPLGRDFLNRQPEPFARNPVEAVEAPGFLDLGPAGQDAARLGAATALRGRAAAKGSGNNLMDALLDENLGGMNLRTMTGPEGAARIQPAVETARNEHQLVQALVGGPDTADKLAAQAALRRGPTLPAQLAETAQAGPVAAAMTALRHIVGGADDLSDDELWELGKLLMASGPEGAKAVQAAAAGDSTAAAAVRGAIRDLRLNARESILGRRGGVAASTALATGGSDDRQLDIFDMLGADR